MNSILTIEDIVKYLEVAYFGDCSDPFKAASNRAYLDMCRTIHDEWFKNMEKGDKEVVKDAVTKLIADRIRNDLANIANGVTQESFDKWHRVTCSGIIKEFIPCHKLSYGQAQKWLNMTCKYLCILGSKEMNDNLLRLHIPVDRIVYQIARENLGVNPPDCVWSRLNYVDYIEYQRKLRIAIEHKEKISYPPILWEFRFWKRGQVGNDTIL